MSEEQKKEAQTPEDEVKKEAREDTENLRALIGNNVELIACTATINQQTKIFYGGIENVI